MKLETRDIVRALSAALLALLAALAVVLLASTSASADDAPHDRRDAEPVSHAVDGLVGPLTKPVTEGLRPATDPVTKPVEKGVAPVVRPITEPAASAVAPVTRPVARGVAGATQPIQRDVVAPAARTAGGVVAPATRGPVPGGATVPAHQGDEAEGNTSRATTTAKTPVHAHLAGILQANPIPATAGQHAHGQRAVSQHDGPTTHEPNTRHSPDPAPSAPVGAPDAPAVPTGASSITQSMPFAAIWVTRSGPDGDGSILCSPPRDTNGRTQCFFQPDVSPG